MLYIKQIPPRSSWQPGVWEYCRIWPHIFFPSDTQECMLMCGNSHIYCICDFPPQKITKTMLCTCFQAHSVKHFALFLICMATQTHYSFSVSSEKIFLHTHPISTLPCAVVSIPGTPTAASLLVDTDWPVRASLTPVACQNEGSCWRSAVEVIKPTEDAWRLSTGSAQFVRQWGRRREVNNIRMRTNSSQWKFGILSFEKKCTKLSDQQKVLRGLWVSKLHKGLTLLNIIYSAVPFQHHASITGIFIL